jgi:hypothetical protein
MANCELLPICPFFIGSLKKMPALAESYRERYCRGDNRLCGRHLVFVARGKSAVPEDLFPNETDRARFIVQFGQDSP